MKKYFAAALPILVLFVGMAFGQQITPNLGLNIPPVGSIGWGPAVQNDFVLIDTAIGSLRAAYKGTYSASTAYNSGEFVLYNGTVYISTVNSNTNHTPGVDTNWQATGTTAGPASGDLCGSYPSPTVCNVNTTAPINSAVGYKVAGAAPANNFLLGNGTVGAFVTPAAARTALGIQTDYVVVTMGDADYHLTPTEAAANLLIITSTTRLTALRHVVAPDVAGRKYIVSNSTVGSPGVGLIFSTGTTGSGIALAGQGVTVAWGTTAPVVDFTGEYTPQDVGSTTFQFSAPYDFDLNGYVRLTYPGIGSTTIFSDHNFLLSQVASSSQGALCDREINGSTQKVNYGMCRNSIFYPATAGPGAPAEGFVNYNLDNNGHFSRLTGTYLYTTGNPVDPLQLAPKQYVDQMAAGSCQSSGTNCLVTPVTITSAVGAITSTRLVSSGEPNRIISTRSGTLAASKVVVLYGSSVCAGYQASSYAASWPGMLQAALQAKGFTVYNLSRVGDSTQALIDRFYTDVAPLNPSIVLNCSGVINDGYNAATFRTHVMQLIKMERDIKTVPLVMTQYANNNYTAQQFADARSLTQEFEDLGVEAIDAWSLADPLTGHYLSNTLTPDGIHMTDAGQLAFYPSIPLEIFDFPDDQQYQPIPSRRVAWQLSSGSTATIEPLAVNLATPATSWTMAAWIKDAGIAGTGIGTPNGKSVLVAYPTTGENTRANNLMTYYGLQLGAPDGPVATSTTLGNTQTWHHMAITYNAFTGLVTLYIDGVVGTTIQASTNSQTSRFAFMGNAAVFGAYLLGGSITDAVIYRSALFPEDIMALKNGKMMRRSAVWGSRFSSLPLQSTGAQIIPSWSANYASASANGSFSTTDEPSKYATIIPMFTPANSTSTCTTNTSWDDFNFHYVCVAPNQIRRIALSSF